jgi:hypothetical protein
VILDGFQKYMAGYGHYGAFAGGAPEVFPGGPPLIGGDDQGIWNGTNTQFWSGAKQSGYYYTPLNAAMLSNASDKWISLQQSASPADQNFFAHEQQKLGVLTNSLYIAVGNHNMFGYSADAIKQVVDAANSLKNEVNAIINYQMQPVIVQQPPPQPQPVAQVAPLTTQYYAPPVGPTAQPGGSQVQIHQDASTGTGPLVSMQPSGTDWTMIGLIGGGVVVAGGILYLVLRRKPSSMGRYRRIRR